MFSVFSEKFKNLLLTSIFNAPFQKYYLFFLSSQRWSCIFQKKISKYKKYKKIIKDIWTNGQKMHRKKIREQSIFKFLGDKFFASKVMKKSKNKKKKGENKRPQNKQKPSQTKREKHLNLTSLPLKKHDPSTTLSFSENNKTSWLVV